jgi:hypothetical protein
MEIILLEKSLFFWAGILSLLSLSWQIYLGIKITKGRPGLLNRHKLNAIILCFVIAAHVALGFLLYP